MNQAVFIYDALATAVLTAISTPLLIELDQPLENALSKTNWARGTRLFIKVLINTLVMFVLAFFIYGIMFMTIKRG